MSCGLRSRWTVSPPTLQYYVMTIARRIRVVFFLVRASSAGVAIVKETRPSHPHGVPLPLQGAAFTVASAVADAGFLYTSPSNCLPRLHGFGHSIEL